MKTRFRRLDSRGFMLLDSTVASVILSFVMVSAISLFILSVRANTNSERGTMAAQLAVALMEEVQLRKWDEKTPIPRKAVNQGSSLGTDGGENDNDKRTFDDIDDFDGWFEHPPKDPMMNSLNQFNIYSSSVDVQYTNASLIPQGNWSNYKKISVCVWSPKMKSTCLYTIRTNR